MRPRIPMRARYAGVAIVVVTLLVVRPAAAQDVPTDPIEPAGRAVCNIASTTAAALSYANFAVPPDSPLTPNDVVVALTPILQLCVDTFPPAPARQCVTAELIPDLGLPLTPPDPLGIVTEQLEALAASLLDPLGIALSGPLHDFFADALACKNLQPPAGGEEYDVVPPDPIAPSSTTTTSTTTTTTSAPTPVVGTPTASPVASLDRPTPAESQVASAPSPDGPLVAAVSALPAPLRGAALVAAALVVVALGVVLRRQFAPRRGSSLLDATRQR